MKATFGTVRQLPSGRYQARYTDPVTGKQVGAPTTFQARIDADAWLSRRRTEIEDGKWRPEAKRPRPITLRVYAEKWVAQRDVKPRTRAEYDRLLAKLILPTLGDEVLAAITPEAVRTWHAALGAQKPTQRARAYALLKSILATAVGDELIPTNPCKIRGGSHEKRARTIRPATLKELETATTAMPERLRLLVLLAAWTALRFGEATELRRRDVDVKAGTLRVRRGVTRVKGEAIVGTPKSSAGSRDVAIPPHLLPLVESHLEKFAQPGKDGLLFPSVAGAHLAPSTLYLAWFPARHVAGRDDLRFHDLRHTGAVLAASTGATLAELMARLGHSTPAMAMRYQHAAAERDREIAVALSKLADES